MKIYYSEAREDYVFAEQEDNCPIVFEDDDWWSILSIIEPNYEFICEVLND